MVRFESHHIGIETNMKRGLKSRISGFESHHLGIATLLLSRHNPCRYCLNRTL